MCGRGDKGDLTDHIVLQLVNPKCLSTEQMTYFIKMVIEFQSRVSMVFLSCQFWLDHFDDHQQNCKVIKMSMKTLCGMILHINIYYHHFVGCSVWTHKGLIIQLVCFILFRMKKGIILSAKVDNMTTKNEQKEFENQTQYDQFNE